MNTQIPPAALQAEMADGRASPLWADKPVARLTALWSEGKSASEAAALLTMQFGAEYARNAVIGKVHRLGLASRPSPIIRQTAVTLVDLEPKHCRWPIGHPGEPGFHFCGAKRLAESSYCREHDALSRQPGTSMQEMERRRKAASMPSKRPTLNNTRFRAA